MNINTGNTSDHKVNGQESLNKSLDESHANDKACGEIDSDDYVIVDDFDIKKIPEKMREQGVEQCNLSLKDLEGRLMRLSPDMQNMLIDRAIDKAHHYFHSNSPSLFRASALSVGLVATAGFTFSLCGATLFCGYMAQKTMVVFKNSLGKEINEMAMRDLKQASETLRLDDKVPRNMLMAREHYHRILERYAKSEASGSTPDSLRAKNKVVDAYNVFTTLWQQGFIPN